MKVIYNFIVVILIMFSTVRSLRVALPMMRMISSGVPRYTRHPLDVSLRDFPLSTSFEPAKDLFNTIFNSMPTLSNTGVNSLPADIKETENSYQIAVDIPGVEKKDISINMGGNDLLITAERSGMKKEENEHFRRVERYSGHVTRSFTLPMNAEQDNIQAEYKDGVLHVNIPKNAQLEKSSKRIDVK